MHADTRHLPPCPAPVLPELPEGLRVRDVLLACAMASGRTPAEIISPQRHVELVRWRQAAMEVAAQATASSMPQIGKTFGRDHTTVLHARRAVAHAVAQGRIEVTRRLAAICRALLDRAATAVAPIVVPAPRSLVVSADPVLPPADEPATRVMTRVTARGDVVEDGMGRDWWATNNAKFCAALAKAHPELVGGHRQ